MTESRLFIAAGWTGSIPGGARPSPAPRPATLWEGEVCGLAGDPLQAFGPALARRGLIVLAPDSICFEDRRHNQTGIEPDDADVEGHYNEMCYRLLNGDTLMRKVLSDSAQGISLLRGHPQVDPERVGMMGHSYFRWKILNHVVPHFSFDSQGMSQ